MAHELENVKDMVYVGDTPWHGLGVKLDKIDTIPDCINWEVETQPIYLANNVIIPSNVAIVRPTDNRVFGIATPDYVPHQNKQLWQTFVDFCDAGQMEIETVGMLRGGEIVWILAKVNRSISVGKDSDITELYALLGSGHNNKVASFSKPTGIRVVCMNTFNIALQGGGVQDRQVHRSEFDVKRAKKFVENAILGFSIYKENADQLVAVPVGSPTLSIAFAQEVIQPDNLNKALAVATKGKMDLETPKKQWINEIFSNSLMQTEFETVLLTNSNRPTRQLIDAIAQETPHLDTMSWWHEFNGATRYVDHVRSRTPDTRVYNAWFGSGAQIKQKAFDTALEYAKAA